MGDCYYILESYANASFAYEQARAFGGRLRKSQFMV
jgi:hypothetical protein